MVAPSCLGVESREWLTVPWGKVLGRGEAGAWPKQLVKGGAPFTAGDRLGVAGRVPRSLLDRSRVPGKRLGV